MALMNSTVHIGAPSTEILHPTTIYNDTDFYNGTTIFNATTPEPEPHHRNYTAGCIQEIGAQAYHDLFQWGKYFMFFGATLPVLVALGLCGDVAVFAILHHREMRGLCTLFLNCILLSDVLYLLCVVLIHTPKAYIATFFTVEDCAKGNPDFWASVEYAQRIFVGAFPVSELAQCLVVWFTTTLIFEQYAVLKHPESSEKWSGGETGLKIVVTIFNALVLSHLIHFFKLVRRDVLYSRVPHMKICLSEIYRNEGYRRYDNFIYYYLAYVIPWIISLYAFCRIILELIHRNREEKAIRRSLPDTGLIPVFKGGRSRRTIVCIAIVFLSCHLMSDMAYSWTLYGRLPPTLEDECYLIPVDKKFSRVAHDGDTMELIFVLGLVLYSSSKFAICYVFGSEFRDIVNGIVTRQLSKLRKSCQVIKELDWRRPADNEMQPARQPRPMAGSALSTVMVRDALPATTYC